MMPCLLIKNEHAINYFLMSVCLIANLISVKYSKQADFNQKYEWGSQRHTGTH